MELAIQRIKGLLPKATASDKAFVLAFEKISRLRSIDLADLADYMERTRSKDLKLFDAFFKKACKLIRKQAEKSPFYKQNLIAIGISNFTSSSKILHPHAHLLFAYACDWFNYDDAHKAYQLTLDHYDPNKKNANSVGRNWAGFWSLISTKNGRVTGVYLGDTMDRDLFYEVIQKVTQHRSLSIKTKSR